MRQRATKILFILAAVMISHAAECCAAKKFLDKLPITSKVASDFSAEIIKERLGTLPLHHIEGIWQFTDRGFIVAIEREGAEGNLGLSQPEGYVIYLIQAPNRALRPGTIIGLIARSASEGVYDARIYTKSMGSTMSLPRNFTFKLHSNDARMTFEKKKNAFSLNLWRVLPYMWRYSVHSNSQPASNDGCIRLFPPPELPLEPVYL